MEINLQTKIAALLDAYPDLEKTLLELSPAFAKLRNPVLRRTVAKVATIQQAAQIAGISPAEMVQTLRREAGLSGDFLPDTADTDEEGTETQPAWFDRTKIAVRYDASPVIDSGGAPMQDILRLANELKSGDILELTAPFKPVPIIDLLKSRGLQAWYFEGKTFFMR